MPERSQNHLSGTLRRELYLAKNQRQVILRFGKGNILNFIVALFFVNKFHANLLHCLEEHALKKHVRKVQPDTLVRAATKRGPKIGVLFMFSPFFSKSHRVKLERVAPVFLQIVIG